MNNDKDLRIKEKIEFFMEEKVKVHVEMHDRTFLNGMILKKIKKNVYWILEDKLGELFLFVKDIYDINKFNKPKELKNEQTNKKL